LEVNGWVKSLVKDEAEVSSLTKAIVKGLNWAGAIGEQKGVGYGRLNEVEALPESVQPVITSPAEAVLGSPPLTRSEAKTSGVWALKMSFDRPLCFSDGNNYNRIKSVGHIPGGALISHIAHSGVLKPSSVDSLRHSHGYLNDACSVVPLSYTYALQKIANNTTSEFFSDAARHKQAFYYTHKQHDPVEPKFSVDWKIQPAIVENALGDNATTNWLETRTAIAFDEENAVSTRLADENKLFSLECVDASLLSKTSGGGETPVWGSCLSVEKLDDDEREKLYTFLETELKGPFGKTDALIESLKIEEAPSNEWQIDDGEACLMLRSDACLLEPLINLDKDCHRRYEEYWQNIDSDLALQALFIDEKLGGGHYVHKRFSTPEPYRPDIITCAGSVFVLKHPDSQTLLKLLKSWSIQGVPDARHYENQPFDKRPWSPNNGYGTVMPVPRIEDVIPKGWSLQYV